MFCFRLPLKLHGQVGIWIAAIMYWPYGKNKVDELKPEATLELEARPLLIEGRGMSELRRWSLAFCKTYLIINQDCCVVCHRLRQVDQWFPQTY
jgi:hypothetical protein